MLWEMDGEIPTRFSGDKEINFNPNCVLFYAFFRFILPMVIDYVNAFWSWVMIKSFQWFLPKYKYWVPFHSFAQLAIIYSVEQYVTNTLLELKLNLILISKNLLSKIRERSIVFKR